jgi:hypothetical protein
MKIKGGSGTVALVLLLIATNTHAMPALEVTAIHVGDLQTASQRSEGLRQRILAGEFDLKEIEFPISSRSSLFGHVPAAAMRFSNQDQRHYVRVSSATFDNLPSEVQFQIVANFTTWEDNYTAYRANIDTRQPDIAQSRLFAKIGVDVAKLPKMVGAEKLLSPLMAKWAYHLSDSDGPNCAFTAFASIFSEFTGLRYMDRAEMDNRVASLLTPIAQPDQWGDVIRFYTANDFHLFTFLGYDKNNPSKKIVFTKNGYGQSRFVFMDYDEVYSIYNGLFGVQAVRYYRRVVAPGAMPIRLPNIAQGNLGEHRDEVGDPLLEYAMIQHPPHGFAPIR